jgi:multiple sugar transport system substrate-binding protein
MTRRLSFLIVAALLVVLAVVLLASCTAQPGELVQTVVVTATPTARPEGVKTVLRVGTGDSGEGLTPHQTIIQQFEANNPDVQVQLEPVGSGDYYARILTQIAAGDPPDLLQIGDDAVPMFVDKGAFVPLDDFIASADFPLDTSIYLPGVMDPGKWNGKQYLLPKDFSPLAVYYNKRLFDEAGLAYPEDGWTCEQFLETAQKLTKTDDAGKTVQWGIQLPGPWTTGFEYWVSTFGGKLISEDGQEFVGYMDSPAVQEAVQFYADLYNKHKVAPPPADMNAFGGGNSEFDNGTAAMRIFGRWPQAGLKANPNVELGVVGTPACKERANVLFWGGFGISALSDDPATTWRFLREYTGEQGAQVWKDWALPTVKAVADESGLSADPIEGVWLNELNYLKPRAYVFTPFWGQTADPALRKVLETVILDPNANVAELLATAAQDAQAALADAQQ